jgi:hypothetical protein
MKHKNWLVPLLAACAFLVTAALVSLIYLNSNTPVPASWGNDPGLRNDPLFYLGESLYILVYVVIPIILGFQIERKQPGNRIGRILAGFSLTVLINFFRELTIYSHFTATAPLLIRQFSAYTQAVIWILAFFTSYWLISIFPDGELPPRRWRWINLCIILFSIFFFLANSSEANLSSAFGVKNPLNPPEMLQNLYEVLLYSGFIFNLAAVVGLVLYLIQQYRSAAGARRQQFKWLALGAGFAAMASLLGFLFGGLFNFAPAQLLTNFSMMFLILGIGIAVLRYRLYDVDLIIRRTLVYGFITIFLVLVYIGSVAILQAIFTSITGQESPLAVVISTLAIAGLFNPLHQRVQQAIDKRFNRRKYNADRVITSFANTVQNEVDADQLVEELIETTRGLIQPEKISLHLKMNIKPDTVWKS